MAKVRGDGQKIGPGILLKVMAGDKFNLRVSSWYNLNGTPVGTAANPLNDLVNVLAGSIAPLAGGKATQTELSGSSFFQGEADKFLQSRTYTSTKPKAYVQWVFFNEQFQYEGTFSGFEQVGGDNTLTTHTKSNLPVGKNGYLYIYVSNETENIDVFFDNLQVTHIKGPILEETHYYPFGLTMAGISSKAAMGDGYPENKKKYNGIEFENDLELNTYDAQFRELDPQIARWWQIDPVTDGYENLSPYASMYDNPLTYSDPLGNEGEACCWEEIKAVGNFVAGAVVGTVAGGIDNVTGSNLRGQLSSSFAGTGAAGHGWNMGLNIADAGGMVLGAAETITGGTGMFGAGVATVGTGGVASPVTIPVGAGSAALATHGVFTMSNSANNMMSQNGRVDAGSNSSSGKKFDGQNSTQNKTSREAYRNAKDQNGIPRSQQPDKTIKPGTPEGNRAGLDKRNVRQDVFTNSKGQKVVIRKDKPATYPDGGRQGNHYNAGQNPQKPKDLTQHHNY